MQRLVALTVGFIVAVISPPVFSESFTDNGTVEVSDEDPAMQKAMARARAGLEGFLKKAGSPPSDTGQYSVKVRVSEGESLEYLWISDLKGQGDLWSGRIENVPVVRSLKKGQAYSFAKTEIVDWTYVDKGRKKVIGNFTTCALLTKEAPEVAQDIQKKYGLECDR